MRGTVGAVIGVGIVGVVVGYLIFANDGNGHYIPLGILLGMKANTFGGAVQGFFERLTNNLPEIRQNIIISGVIGGAVGLVISIAGRRRRR